MVDYIRGHGGRSNMDKLCLCCQRDKIHIVNSFWQTTIPSTVFQQAPFTSSTTENEVVDYFAWLEHLISTYCSHLPCMIKCEIKLFRGRPCMVQWKINCKHLHFQQLASTLLHGRRRRRRRQQHVTILFFPNRTIQFIGSYLTNNNVYTLYQHIQQLFSTSSPFSFLIPFPCLKTMTVVYQLHQSINLCNIFTASNSYCTYETELFPGAQLSFWSPLHVILFHTGSVTISGVQSFSQIDTIIHDLMTNKYFPLFDTLKTNCSLK